MKTKEATWIECDFIPQPMHFTFPFDKHKWDGMSEDERIQALQNSFIEEMGEEYCDCVDEFEVSYFEI